MKRPSKKQLASCITSLYTLSWPKWKQAAHLVACKISYKREEEEEKRITLAHIHTCVCICSRVFFLVRSERKTHIRSLLSQNAPKKCAIQHQRLGLWFALVAMHRNCCVQTENEHDPVFVRVLFILFVFFFCWCWGSFFCYFLNSLLCKLWIRYHSFAQHAFCCCFDHFEKLPKWWIGFFLVPFSISLVIFLSNRTYKCVILCASTALVVSLLKGFYNKI